MPIYVKILWVLVPKKYIQELVIKGLEYLALQTTNRIDDKIVFEVKRLINE